MPSDSLGFIRSKSSNQWVKSDDLDLFSIADSMTMHLQSNRSIATTLTKHCHDETYDYPVLQLITMARSLFIPSRFVHGYHYQNGFWVYKYWSEMGLNGEWVIFDPNTSTKVNPALYLSLGKSYLEEGFINIINSSKVQKIEIKRFLSKNKLHNHIKEKAITYEKQTLDIPGIGLRVLLPERFSIDTTQQPVTTLIGFNSELGETVTVSYISKSMLTEDIIYETLNSFIDSSEIKNSNQFKFDNYIKESDQRYIMVIKQGNSYIEIKTFAPYGVPKTPIIRKNTIQFKE